MWYSAPEIIDQFAVPCVPSVPTSSICRRSTTNALRSISASPPISTIISVSDNGSAMGLMTLPTTSSALSSGVTLSVPTMFETDNHLIDTRLIHAIRAAIQIYAYDNGFCGVVYFIVDELKFGWFIAFIVLIACRFRRINQTIVAAQSGVPGISCINIFLFLFCK